MTKKRKLLASSFMIALVLVLPYHLHAMEMEFMNLKPEENILSKSIQSFIDTVLTAVGYETCQKIEPLDIELSKSVPLDCWHLIVEYTAPKNITLNKNLNNLRFVSKDWCDFINKYKQAWFAIEEPCWKAWYGVLEHEHTYKIIKNMVVIYRPNPDSDEGMISLTIPSDVDPLDYTFDLSNKALFGNTGDYVSISIGYRKEKKSINDNKVEIWIAPWFLIKQRLSSSAKHFEPIMKKDFWNEEIAPVGIIFTRGCWDDMECYEYLTNQNTYFIANNNCKELWNKACPTHRVCRIHSASHDFYQKISLSFNY